MNVKNVILLCCFVLILYDLQAQEKYHIQNQYELSIKELIQPTKYNMRWHFGTSYICQGDFSSVLCCLLGNDCARLKIKGSIPTQYIDLKLSEPSRMDLGSLLTNRQQQLNESDSLSLVNVAIALLEQTYHFKVTSIMDTTEVWCLQVADSTKLVRYNEMRDGDDRGAGLDFRTNEWESIGMLLHHLCVFVADEAHAIIYDETNETGSFTFVSPRIPRQYMKDLNTLNRLLETHYGLHFIKRKQLEPLKLIEFK
jgi:hypothetical protein